MPNLFNSLRECFGFSQIITSQSLSTLIALLDMSSKFPIGVAIKYIPKFLLLTSFIFILLTSCTPINSPTQSEQTQNKNIIDLEINIPKNVKLESGNKEDKQDDYELNKEIIVLFSNQDDKQMIKQFINILELAIYKKNLTGTSLEIKFFNNEQELENIIMKTKKVGRVYIGPTKIEHTKVAKKHCNNQVIFFSFSSDTSLATRCIFLINFFPKNELEQLFLSLDNGSKVALLYPENNYGYNLNMIIDEIVNDSDAVLVNRASYKNDLSNVRDAIKELGKYDLRKYELERQKQILSKNNDQKSKLRLKKLNKFKTTNDYEFTHILLADYGLNLLQVAPLLPYYDIDPNIVQFLGTGVIDDNNFFIEPSLQGAIFPGVEKIKRLQLLDEYKDIYDENLLRISTLPYDLIGLINYLYSNNLKIKETYNLLNSNKIKFDGVDGKFYFKQNMIERNLDILQISNGSALKIN